MNNPLSVSVKACTHASHIRIGSRASVSCALFLEKCGRSVLHFVNYSDCDRDVGVSASHFLNETEKDYYFFDFLFLEFSRPGMPSIVGKWALLLALLIFQYPILGVQAKNENCE